MINKKMSLLLLAVTFFNCIITDPPPPACPMCEVPAVYFQLIDSLGNVFLPAQVMVIRDGVDTFPVHQINDFNPPNLTIQPDHIYFCLGGVGTYEIIVHDSAYSPVDLSGINVIADQTYKNSNCGGDVPISEGYKIKMVPINSWCKKLHAATQIDSFIIIEHVSSPAKC